MKYSLRWIFGPLRRNGNSSPHNQDEQDDDDKYSNIDIYRIGIGIPKP